MLHFCMQNVVNTVLNVCYMKKKGAKEIIKTKM